MISATILAGALAAQMAAPAPWSELHRTDSLVVHTRARAGTSVNEMRAVGIVDAPAEVLWALVRDVENHTSLLPDTTVSKIVAREGDTVFVLQRSEPRVLDARAYVIAVREHEETLPDGRVRHVLRWRAEPRYASLVGKDAVRVDTNEGFWAVEALPDGRARITFQLLFDPAGYVPAFLVNASQRLGAEQALAVLTQAARRASST